MILMGFMGLLLLLGLTLVIWWGGTGYESWGPAPAPDDPEADPSSTSPSVGVATLRYLRGVAIALVGGFWAGALVTGPAMRLIMRLLAVTAGGGAQGELTEAREVVGNIDLDGTIGLYVFGGLLPGLLSGAIYVVFRGLLPGGRLGGVTFGLLHLVVAATRVDPLRPENPDFDLVGPGWLSVVTFGVATILHGMAVAAIANRFSARFPPKAGSRAAWARAALPLALPVLMLVPGAFLLVPIVIGLVIAVAISQTEPALQALRSDAATFAGRAAIGVLTLALLPSTLIDLRDVAVRQHPATSPDRPAR